MIKLTMLVLVPLQVFCNLNDYHRSSSLLSVTPTVTLQATIDAGHRRHQLKETSAVKRHYLQDDGPGGCSSGIGCGSGAVGGNRFRRGVQKDLYIKPPITWNYLRRFICGAGNPKCMNDERLSNMQPELLRKLSRMSELRPPPSHSNDVVPRQESFPSEFSSNDVNIWRSLNLSGRREGPLYVEEPDFVVRGEQEDHNAAHLFDYIDDPFIPQRGRKNKISHAVVPKESRFVWLLGRQQPPDVRPQKFVHQNKETNTLTMTSHYNGKKKTAALTPAAVLYNSDRWKNQNDHSTEVYNDDDDNDGAVDNEMLNTIPSLALDGNYYFNTDNSVERNKRNLPANDLSHAIRDTFYLTRWRRGAVSARTPPPTAQSTDMLLPQSVENRSKLV